MRNDILMRIDELFSDWDDYGYETRLQALKRRQRRLGSLLGRLQQCLIDLDLLRLADDLTIAEGGAIALGSDDVRGLERLIETLENTAERHRRHG